MKVHALENARPVNAVVVFGLAMAFAMTPVAGQFSFASAASEPVPVKRSAPDYPKGAERRGIEGWVNLEFTVDENGQVVAPRIVEASPPGVFDSAAIEAVTKWKYEPAQDGGAPVATPGISIKLTFKLE